ncbi:MAG: hypothetical protein APR63_08405 [Desulfuromonas sp. SDB]|nr:MAG: hypothetical protein APR63_08405 [Desulfuromonas sp. SDB]
MIFLYLIQFYLWGNLSYPCLSPQDKLTGSDSMIVEDQIQITIRMGQGGYQDSRSPIGKLGGGQLAVDFKPQIFPVALSFSSEYYTNSPCPSHNYEIAGLFVINALYSRELLNFNRITVFAGGGMGWIEVPKGEDFPDQYEYGFVYDLEAGVNIKAFWKIGFYGIYKYIYAHELKNNVPVIDFNQHAILLGISLNFTL